MQANSLINNKEWRRCQAHSDPLFYWLRVTIDNTIVLLLWNF